MTSRPTPHRPLALVTLLAAGLLVGAAPALADAPPRAGAFAVRGAILEHYLQLGGASGPLGRPLSDELATPDGTGRYTVFQGGSIYWSPGSGAWEVHGRIRDAWGALGWERSRLHYPTSDEQARRGGARSLFQGGALYWSPDTGAHQVEGLILARWEAVGAETSGLGYPVTDEHDMPGGRMNDFQGGQVSWTPAHGAYVSRGVGAVSRADLPARTATLDDLQQTVTWDRGDEFGVVPAGSDAGPVTISRAQFERRLQRAVRGDRMAPSLVVDWSPDPARTSRFVLLEQSLPGLGAVDRERAYGLLG